MQIQYISMDLSLNLSAFYMWYGVIVWEVIQFRKKKIVMNM